MKTNHTPIVYSCIYMYVVMVAPDTMPQHLKCDQQYSFIWGLLIFWFYHDILLSTMSLVIILLNQFSSWVKLKFLLRVIIHNLQMSIAYKKGKKAKGRDCRGDNWLFWTMTPFFCKQVHVRREELYKFRRLSEFNNGIRKPILWSR